MYLRDRSAKTVVRVATLKIEAVDQTEGFRPEWCVSTIYHA